MFSAAQAFACLALLLTQHTDLRFEASANVEIAVSRDAMPGSGQQAG
ncbi:MAG: hypothetical protein WDO68_00610 [Gammaproteobacteria bacterium]